MKFELAGLSPQLLGGGVERRRVHGERLELIEYRYPPGSRFPVHAHQSEQMTIVLSGELVFTFDDEDVRLSAGEGILIEGNRSHGAYVPGTSEQVVTYNVFTPVRKELPSG